MAVHLHLDPFSGIAGDMLLGALIDLGVTPQQLDAALSKLPVHGQYDLVVERVQRHGIGAVDLKVKLRDFVPTAPRPALAADGNHHHHGQTHQHSPTRTQAHHHVHYSDLVAMIDALATSARGKQRLRKAVDALAHAEARVHGLAVEKVHFHEVGAVDSIVDMFASVAALEILNIDSVSCGPLPLSRGFVRCQHGRMPVPAPAAAYLMEGMPTVGVDREGELVTPTGAALVVGLCDQFGPAPAMTLRQIGYGAGDRNDPAYPNLLRVFLGER